jgi:hypothetical protein
MPRTRTQLVFVGYKKALSCKELTGLFCVLSRELKNYFFSSAGAAAGAVVSAAGAAGAVVSVAGAAGAVVSTAGATGAVVSTAGAAGAASSFLPQAAKATANKDAIRIEFFMFIPFGVTK